MINNSDLFEFEGNIITICLTSHCNTNCKHCYIGHHGAWNYDELKALLPVFRKKYKIYLNGAEILTNQDYISLFPVAGETGLMTNGKVIVDNPSIIN